MRGLRLSALVLALLAVLGPVAPARALPGDEPITPVGPPAGAALAPDVAGIVVVCRCPVYQAFDAGGGFVAYGGPSQYGVSLAASPAVGPDGRLAGAVLRSTASTSGMPEGSCSSVLGDGRPGGPQASPGTYFRQVDRLCTDCAGGNGTSEVRTVRVEAQATLGVRPATAVSPA